MRLRLKSTEGVLAETHTEAVTSEIRIGRNADCQWRVPTTYRRIGRAHARLVKEGSRLFIEDLGSQNGTFVGERRVTREEVTPGSVFSLAQELTFEADNEPIEISCTSTGSLRTALSTIGLVGWTGVKRGSRIAVTAFPFDLGSAPEANLSLNVDLVSKRHARIVQSDGGGYVIQDLGSTNGTSVNGRKVTPEALQPLRHGDSVFIADQGFFFDEGRGVHPVRQAWLVGLSIAASIVLVATGYRLKINADHKVVDAPRVHTAMPVLECLNRLDNWPPPLDGVLADMSRCLETEAGPQRQYVANVRDELMAVGAALTKYQTVLARLAEMPPDPELNTLEATLGSLTPPGTEVRIKKLAAAIVERRDLLIRLLRLAREIRAAESTGDWSRSAQVWGDETAIAKVLDCDTASMAPPETDRTTPMGEYDRYVGTEFFQGFCRQLKYGPDLRPHVSPFTTELQRARAHYSQAAECVMVADKLGHAGDSPQAGALGELVRRCRAEMEFQNRLVERFVHDASVGDTRRALIAAGIALQLAPQPDALTTDALGRRVSVKEWAAALFERVGAGLPSL